MTNTRSIIKELSPRDRMEERARRLYQASDRLSGGILSLLGAIFKSMSEAHASEAAAGIAYYAFFSFFPLMILLIILGSSFVETKDNYSSLIHFISEILPPAEELAQENIQRVWQIESELELRLSLQELVVANFRQILDLRIPMGIVALIGLLWSSTSVFVILASNIDRAWRNSKGRDFLEWHLMSMAMVGGLLIGLIFLFLAIMFLFGLFDRILVLILGDSIYPTLIGSTLPYRLVPGVVVFLGMTILYRWAPKIEIRWSDAGLSALVATSLWELSKTGFSWYVDSGLSKYQIIYGSLGTVIALMLWIYLSCLICLFGAHFTAQIVSRRKEKALSD